MATVDLTREAREQMRRLPPTILEHIRKLIQRLEQWPAVSGASRSEAIWAASIGCGQATTVSASGSAARWLSWTRLVTGGSSMSKTANPSATRRIKRNGRRMVLLEEGEYERLRQKADEWEPVLPEAKADGNYPAAETAAVIQAQISYAPAGSSGCRKRVARRAGIRKPRSTASSKPRIPRACRLLSK